MHINWRELVYFFLFSFPNLCEIYSVPYVYRIILCYVVLKFLRQNKDCFSFTIASSIAQLKLNIFLLNLALFVLWFRNRVEVRSRKEI